MMQISTHSWVAQYFSTRSVFLPWGKNKQLFVPYVTRWGGSLLNWDMRNVIWGDALTVLMHGDNTRQRNTRHFPRQQNKQKYQQINWKTFFTGHTELQPSDGRDRTRTRGRGFTWCRGRGVSSKLSTTKWRGGHDFCSVCLAFQYSLL